MSRATTRTRILRACYSFMLPVARFLLDSGISFREFAEIARTAFVEVAVRDYGIRGRPTNISRVSAMTGIGRKEVKRVRGLKSQYDDDPLVELSPLSDVLHHWFTHPSYLDQKGRPRVLSYKEGETSFAELVRLCAGDVPIGAIKVELIRCGAITEEENGDVRALRRYVVPDTFDEKLITSMTFGLRGLASTIAFNSNPLRTEPTRFERIVRSDPLTHESLHEVRSVLHTRLTVFTEEIDDLFATLDRDAARTSKRVSVGLYYYEDDQT
jgi:uncharacterized protein DUF6502